MKEISREGSLLSRSPQRGAAPWRKGKGSPRQPTKTQGPRVYARSLASKRTEGTDEEAANQREDWVGANQKKLGRRACTRSRMYGGIKKGAVAFVRSPVANQRGAATVHRPTSDYRFSASRLPNPPHKSTNRNHTLWIDVVTRYGE